MKIQNIPSDGKWHPVEATVGFIGKSYKSVSGKDLQKVSLDGLDVAVCTGRTGPLDWRVHKGKILSFQVAKTANGVYAIWNKEQAPVDSPAKEGLSGRASGGSLEVVLARAFACVAAASQQHPCIEAYWAAVKEIASYIQNGNVSVEKEPDVPEDIREPDSEPEDIPF